MNDDELMSLLFVALNQVSGIECRRLRVIANVVALFVYKQRLGSRPGIRSWVSVRARRTGVDECQDTRACAWCRMFLGRCTPRLRGHRSVRGRGRSWVVASCIRHTSCRIAARASVLTVWSGRRNGWLERWLRYPHPVRLSPWPMGRPPAAQVAVPRMGDPSAANSGPYSNPDLATAFVTYGSIRVSVPPRQRVC